MEFSGLWLSGPGGLGVPWSSGFVVEEFTSIVEMLLSSPVWPVSPDQHAFK